MKSSEILRLAESLEALGRSMEEGEETVEDRVDSRSFYLPTIPRGFYTGCLERLRDLTMPRRLY